MVDKIQKNRYRILVVDDDKDIVQTIKGNLQLDGYEVLTAFNGKIGLHIAKTTRPDLVILDLNLPDIDGIKACEIMRREFDFPIIMLTARDTLSARIKSIFKRVERSLVKNFYEHDDLAIDFKSRSVAINEKSVKLTKTEFELLELFVSYPDEVLSREFIQQQIWPFSLRAVGSASWRPQFLRQSEELLLRCTTCTPPRSSLISPLGRRPYGPEA